MDEQTSVCMRGLEDALEAMIWAADHLDRAAWLMRSAIDDGDPDYLDTAVQAYEQARDDLSMGPDSPLSRARYALYGQTVPEREVDG